MDSKYVTNEAMATHIPTSRWLGIHALCVHPDFRHHGNATLLMKGFLERVKKTGTVDSVTLICHDYLVGFYKNLGYRHNGVSNCQYAGVEWQDMVYEF